MKLKYAVEQRLRLIDFLLDSYAHVGRKELMDFFGIAEAQATRDFAAYRDLAPENMTFDQTEKRYYRTRNFCRIWQ